MSKRIKLLSSFYENINEDERLIQNRHGQLEYFTTTSYIHRYAKNGAKIIEIGAGTGKYSINLAKEDFDVTLLLGPLYHL